MTNSGHVAFQRDEESVCCELTILYRSFQERGSKLQEKGCLRGRWRLSQCVRCGVAAYIHEDLRQANSRPVVANGCHHLKIG